MDRIMTQIVSHKTKGCGINNRGVALARTSSVASMPMYVTYKCVNARSDETIDIYFNSS